MTGRKPPSNDPRTDKKRGSEPDRNREDQGNKDALDSELDDELEDTFPASDPPSVTRDPHH